MFADCDTDQIIQSAHTNQKVLLIRVYKFYSFATCFCFKYWLHQSFLIVDNMISSLLVMSLNKCLTTCDLRDIGILISYILIATLNQKGMIIYCIAYVSLEYLKDVPH